MRWFVEISPLGASEGQKQKWCLEAAGWQPALKEARSHRGEEGPLGGFSIELLDDGARAVDPVKRIRYVIRSAPDDAPLTHTKDGPVKGAAPKSEPAKQEPPKSEPAKQEPPKSEPAKQEPPKSEPAKAAPAAIEPAKQASESDDVDIPIDDEDSADMAPLPDYELLQAREENPNERSPLTYREHVYAVDPSTSDAEIERLLRARFEAVKRDLEGAKGRFVNLAIFDHVFTGKPARRPRGTLAWKDWRGGPEIRFPAAERASLEPPSFAAPTSFSAAVPQPSVPPTSLVPSTSVAPTQPAPLEAAPPSAKAAPEPVAAPVAAPVAVAAPVTAPVAASAHAVAAPEPVAAPVAVAAPEPVAAPVAVAAPAASVTLTPPTISSPPTSSVVSTEPSPAAAPAETAVKTAAPEPAAEPKVEAPAAPIAPPVDVKIEPPVDVKIEPPVDVKIEPAARPSAAPVSAAPKTMPAAAQKAAPAPPAKREAFIPAVKTAAEAGKRMAGDDLIGELFEACGDLQFLRDSLEGADFVLSLALEKLPSEVGLVSLFDINRREFVVIRQAGGPRSIVLSRLPERAGLAQPAMRKKSAIVIADASKEPRALDDRFRALGIELHSMMIAPVEVSGRYLGLIELCNPVDGKAFTEGDGHALTYIGEQYAEFVAERGVQLDPEMIIERHQKR